MQIFLLFMQMRDNAGPYSAIIPKLEGENRPEMISSTRVPDEAALAVIRRGVARIVQVTDDAIADAIRIYWTDTHNLAEGAGAAPLAAALKERDRLRDRARRKLHQPADCPRDAATNRGRG